MFNAASGAASAAAGVGAAADFISSERTNAANAREASKSRKHDIWMYRNRYQMTVNDLKRAGLNPMMLYQKGGPAGAPQGAKAVMENPGARLSQHVSNAVQASRVRKENEVRDAQIDDIKASAELKRAQADVAAQDKWLSESKQEYFGELGVTESKRRWVEVQREALLKEQVKLAQWKVHSAEAAARKKKAQDELDLDWMKFDNAVKRLGNVANVGKLIPKRFNIRNLSKFKRKGKYDNYLRSKKGFDRYNRFLDSRFK